MKLKKQQVVAVRNYIERALFLMEEADYDTAYKELVTVLGLLYGKEKEREEEEGQTYSEESGD